MKCSNSITSILSLYPSLGNKLILIYIVDRLSNLVRFPGDKLTSLSGDLTCITLWASSSLPFHTHITLWDF